MALTPRNKLDIAFKKLSGKSHTGTNNAYLFNEPYKTSLQLQSYLFYDNFPSNPNTSVTGSVTGPVQYVRFEVEKYNRYTANNPTDINSIWSGDGYGGTYNLGFHAYRLRLPLNYETNPHYNHSKRGNDPFVNGKFVHESDGKLQLVPDFIAGPNYAPVIKKNHATVYSATDDIDWYLDYYSGILFVQDPPGDGDQVEFVEAFIYIGEYLRDIVHAVSSSLPNVGGSVLAGSGSANRIAFFTSHNFVTSSNGLVFLNGNLGINVSNPTYRLHANGNVGITGSLDITGSLYISSSIYHLPTSPSASMIYKDFNGLFNFVTASMDGQMPVYQSATNSFILTNVLDEGDF